jgi:hypothetical protein
MTTYTTHFRNAAIGTTVVLAALILASCAATPQSSAPQQVAASNPTVTYKYRNDDELIQANQRAVDFCNQHQALPQARSESFSTDENGNKLVVFECVPGTVVTAVTPLRQSNSEISYNVWTDQDMLNASRDAHVYCRNNGWPQMHSSVVTHSNNRKTVTFNCSS